MAKELHLTQSGKKKFQNQGGYCLIDEQFQTGDISPSKISSSIDDFNWLSENTPIAKKKKLGRFQVSEIMEKWEGIGDFAIILRDGHLFDVDDEDVGFEDEENQTGYLYTFAGMSFQLSGKGDDQIVEGVEFGEINNLKGDQYVNLIADEDSSLF